VRRVKVRIRLFAQLREIVGQNEVELSVETPTAAAAFEALVSRHPKLASFRNSIRFAVGEEYVPPGTTLTDSSELVLIPPISGG